LSKKLKGLSAALTGVNGKVLLDSNDEPETVKALIANSLARGKSPDPVRAMMVAMSIYSAGDEIDVEDADLALIEKAVKEDTLLTNLGKAAIIKVLR
jgi:hypothetical protein